MTNSINTAARLALARIAGREDGQGMVEYAFILMLVALVLIVMTTLLGHQVNNVFSNVSNGLAQ